MEDDTLSLKELLSIDLTKVPEQESLQILDNNFPCCYIIRIGDSLEITLEEHIYTKYWFHKYHASVFAEAMIKAVKRLATEGFPYFSEELDNDDDVHLFVRWALAESIHIPNQTLIDNIELSFNKVYERANNMLENSDSILILGKDTGESMELLKRIQTYLDNKGFYTYIIKEQPDLLGESVMQKVLRYALSSRLVIIENTEPSGHLYEFPHIVKMAEMPTVVLQQKDKGATWMFEDLYQRMTNIKKIEYTNDNVILSADLAVIFFKYQTSSSSINRSSNGLLILLLKVSAMWTYLSVVLILLCPISSFTILMSVPCSSR